MLKRMTRGSRSVLFTFHKNGQKIGRFTLDFNHERKLICVWSVHIDEPYQGKGFGQQMMRDCVKLCRRLKHYKRVWLNFLRGNEAAERVYTKVGFKVFRTGYSTKEAQIVFERS